MCIIDSQTVDRHRMYSDEHGENMERNREQIGNKKRVDDGGGGVAGVASSQATVNTRVGGSC